MRAQRSNLVYPYPVIVPVPLFAGSEARNPILKNLTATAKQFFNSAKQTQTINQQLSAANPKPESVNLRPESVNPKPESVNLKGESVNKTPESVNLKVKSVNKTPESVNLKPESVNKIQISDSIALEFSAKSHFGFSSTTIGCEISVK